MFVYEKGVESNLVSFYIIFISDEQSSDLQALVLLCTPDKDLYRGFIPNDQVMSTWKTSW